MQRYMYMIYKGICICYAKVYVYDIQRFTYFKTNFQIYTEMNIVASFGFIINTVIAYDI